MKPGDEVVCVSKGPWVIIKKKFFFFKKRIVSHYHPKKDEVVLITATTPLICELNDQQHLYLQLKEYPGSWFNSCGFRKLPSTSRLEKELSDITIPARNDDD